MSNYVIITLRNICEKVYIQNVENVFPKLLSQYVIIQDEFQIKFEDFSSNVYYSSQPSISLFTGIIIQNCLKKQVEIKESVVTQIIQIFEKSESYLKLILAKCLFYITNFQRKFMEKLLDIFFGKLNTA